MGWTFEDILLYGACWNHLKLSLVPCSREVRPFKIYLKCFDNFKCTKNKEK